MPYTTNVPSTTITAAWGNSNVRDQVVTAFASAAARTSAVTSPVEGMVSYLADSKRVEMYNGTAWVRVAPKGRVGGTRYNAGTTVIIAGAGIGPAETLTGMTTPALALEANRSFLIRVRIRVLCGTANAGTTMRVRDTNVSGTVRATFEDVIASTTATHAREFTGIYETGAIDETKTWVVTGQQGSGTANYYAGDAGNAVYIDALDVGPAGSITVV